MEDIVQPFFWSHLFFISSDWYFTMDKWLKVDTFCSHVDYSSCQESLLSQLHLWITKWFGYGRSKITRMLWSHSKNLDMYPPRFPKKTITIVKWNTWTRMIRKEFALAGHIVGEGNPVHQPHLCFRDGKVACYSSQKLMTTSNRLARKPLKPRHLHWTQAASQGVMQIYHHPRHQQQQEPKGQTYNKFQQQPEQKQEKEPNRTRMKKNKNKSKNNNKGKDKDKQRQTRTKTTTTEALFPSTRQTGLLLQAGCFSIGLPWYPPLSSKNNIWNLVLCQKKAVPSCFDVEPTTHQDSLLSFGFLSPQIFRFEEVHHIMVKLE